MIDFNLMDFKDVYIEPAKHGGNKHHTGKYISMQRGGKENRMARVYFSSELVEELGWNTDTKVLLRSSGNLCMFKKTDSTVSFGFHRTSKTSKGLMIHSLNLAMKICEICGVNVSKDMKGIVFEVFTNGTDSVIFKKGEDKE